MNYFEFYAGDYLRDTTRLGLIEHGAYLRLMIAYYSEETPLPVDMRELYTITCAVSKADKDAVKRVAERFFPVSKTDGLRHKNRVDEEIAKAQKRIAVARANGSKGGKKPNPAGNPAGNPTGNPTGIHTEPHRPTHSGEALHTPHAIHQKEQDQKQRGAKAPTLTLPDWLPESTWAEWHKFRNSRKGWTPKARELSLSTLTKLRTKGHDPTAVIEQSIERGWTGLFEIKPEVTRGNDQSSRRESTAERAARFAREGDEREDARNAASARQGHAKILAADGSDIRSSLDVRVR